MWQVLVRSSGPGMTLGTARTSEWFLGTLKTFYIIALQGVCCAASQENGFRTIPFRCQRRAPFPAEPSGSVTENSLPAVFRFLNRTMAVAHPTCIGQGATILTDSTVDFEWGRPLRAGIESQAGPNCSGTGSNEKKLAERHSGNPTVYAGRCCCRLLCTLKRFAQRALKIILSAEAIAMTIASGPNSRLRNAAL